MSREIKFRCYDKYLKQMVPHVHGFHFMGEVMAFGILESYIFENLGDRKGSLNRWGDIEVMQYTGLKDKNGKEIYEGDIVKETEKDWDQDDDMLTAKLIDKERISFVEFKDRGFWVHDESFGWEGECLWNWNELEVIGNIYENPELLNSTPNDNRSVATEDK